MDPFQSSGSNAASSNSNAATDPAVQRLVHAIVGHDQGGMATSLARRVLGSQIGGGSGVAAATSPTSSDLHHLWRRLERKTSSTDRDCRRDTERLYQQLVETSRNDRSSSLDAQVLPKLATVLVKLVGHKKYMPQQPPSVPTPVASNSNNLMWDQEQQQVQHPPSVRNEQNSVNNSVTPHGTTAASLPSLTTMSTSESLVVDEQRLYEERKELEKEEALLLRECLYSLQGIDGERIRYFRHRDKEGREADGAYEGIRVQSPALEYPTALLHSTGRVVPTRLGSGAMDALRICGEAGWLYNRVAEYVQSVQDDNPHHHFHHQQPQSGQNNAGVVARAFAWKLAQELRDYHSLLSRYEQQLIGSGEDGRGDQMTLRQLLVELRQPTHRLKILALLTDGVGNLNGGNLLQALFLHSQHGDSRHSKLVQSLLFAASRPWFDILYQWTTRGILSDPHDEFFVTEKSAVKMGINYLSRQQRHNTNNPETNLWRNQYTVQKDQIPSGILDKELVQQAYVVGKGINFIRKCLMDAQWTMQLLPQKIDQQNRAPSQMTEEELKEALGYRYQPTKTQMGKTTSLAKTLTQAADLVHSHILRTLKQDHHLTQHLLALKQFLLLGQGDFFSVLMDGLHAEFGIGRSSNDDAGGGGHSIYKHSVLAIVESALRSSNAKYLPQYVLDRLQVELLMNGDISGNVHDDSNSFHLFLGGDGGPPRKMTVWDVFLLDYQVPDPLLAIVHSAALDQYKFVFSFLFSLKKVEFMLNYTWRQGAILQHALQKSAQYNDIEMSKSVGYRQASYLLRNVAITRQSMNHWIVNLKSYIMLEVIEGGWKRLLVAIDAAQTLDEMIEAHDRYLTGIVRKCLLRDSSGRQQPSQAPHEDYADDQANQRRGQHPQSTTELSLSRQLQLVLSLVNEFCDLQESFFGQALQSAEIATAKRLEAERRQRQGQWGFDSEHDKSEVENFFGLTNTNVLNEFIRISHTFHEHTTSMLQNLNYRVNNATSTTEPEAVDGQDENDDGQNNYFDDASTCYDDVATAKRFATVVIDDDLDPQRFLIAQLDHNQFYSLQDDEG